MTSASSTGTNKRRTSEEDAEPVLPPHDHGPDRPAAGEVAVHGYSSNKQAHLKRLARVEGQVRGIARMVDEDKYCIDVLTQVSAVTKALQAVSLGLLEEHMAHCVAHAVAAGGDEGAAKLREASDAIARLVRS